MAWGLFKTGLTALFGGATVGVAGLASYGAAPETTKRVVGGAGDLASKGYDVVAPVLAPVVDAVKAGAGNLWEDTLEHGNEKLEDLIYNNLLAPLGVDRQKFDAWYETINPLALSGTFAAIKGMDFTLERIGIDLIGMKGAAVLALGYHFMVREGGVGKLSNFLVDSGVITPETKDMIGNLPVVGSLMKPGNLSDAHNAAAEGQEVTPPPQAEAPAPVVRVEEMAPAV